MSDNKSAATMSTRDSKYEVLRVRPRKDKDRDKDSDKRSSIAGTGGIIVRKHRDSTTSRSIAPSDSASQACAETQSQGTTDAPSPDSETTLPLLRASSAVSLTSRTSPSSIQTPAALQAYLESEAGDTESTVTQDKPTANHEAKKEWIGPPEGTSTMSDEAEDSTTPRPNRRGQAEIKSKQPDPSSSGSPEGKHGCVISPDWLELIGYIALYENPFLSPQMANAFLPNTPGAAAPPPHHAPMLTQPYRQPYPKAPASPAQTWHDAPSQRPSSVLSASRSVTSDPSSTTTYIGQSQQSMFQHQENPMLLLQRVSNAMPDIYMLMQHFHESCATLGMRESHIRQLEMQKEADAKRQSNHIDKLTNEIEAVLAKHAAKVDKLETKINKLEESKASLQRSLAKEMQLKEDSKASIEKLHAEQKQLAMKYLAEKEEMAASHSKEKSRLISDHTASQRALSDHSHAQARIAEANMTARLGEMNRLHEHERQMLEERRARERGELQDGHAKARRDLEDALTAKVKVIDEERRDFARMRQAWEKEHDQLSLRRDEDRARHRKDLDDQSHDLMRKYQKEKDEVVKSVEASHATHQAKNQAVIREQESALESYLRQAAEAQNTISKLQRDAEAHKRYASDAQEAFRKLQKENADLRTALETAQSRQQLLVEQQQDQTYRIHSDNDIQNRSRTPSRQRSDPQETIKLRKDLENERGRNEDAQDTIIKLRRELEVLRSHGINTEKKHPQTSSSSSSSPISQKASMEGRSPLQQKTSNESSTSQKQAESPANHAAKSKNVAWQT